MDMSTLDLYFSLIGLAVGLYCLYTWFKLKREGKLFTNQLLVPKDSKPEDCVDEEGYIRVMSPLLLIAGLVWAVTGALDFANCTLHFLDETGSFYLSMADTLVCILNFIVYIIVWLRARKQYWVL